MLGDYLQCEITEIGKLYLEQGIYEKEEALAKEKEKEFLGNNGFNSIEAEEDKKRKMDALMEENIRLTNKKLKYELHTRWIAIISFIVSVASIIVTLLSSCHYTTP